MSDRVENDAVTVCTCDFCAGRKRWQDNWCVRCAKVRLAPPKHWENMDVCDACDEAIRAEIAEEEATHAPR